MEKSGEIMEFAQRLQTQLKSKSKKIGYFKIISNDALVPAN